MPLGPRRIPRSRGRTGVRRRELVWATVDQGITLANASANVDMLAGLEVAGSSVLGLTIIRTHLRLTATAGVVAADLLRVGVAIGRNTDIGNPIPAGALTAAQPNLDWMLLDRRVCYSQLSFVAARPEFEYDLRSKRRMHELNQTLVLSLVTSGAAATAYQLWARVLCALP